MLRTEEELYGVFTYESLMTVGLILMIWAGWYNSLLTAVVVLVYLTRVRQLGLETWIRSNYDETIRISTRINEISRELEGSTSRTNTLRTLKHGNYM